MNKLEQRQITYRAAQQPPQRRVAARPQGVRRSPPPRQRPAPARRPPAPPRRPEALPPARPGAGSYRQFAARQRRRRAQGRLLFLAAALILVGAVVYILLHTGGLGGPALPAAAPLPGDSGVQALAAAPASGKFVVAVDPGHGGVDPGNTVGDYYERYMTWDTANELLALLEADGRFAPFLTLSEQESTDPDAPRVKPSERAERAAQGGAQLLVSVHGNSDPGCEANGFECFPVPPGRTHYEQSMDLALKIADGFSAEGSRLRGVNGVRFMYYDDYDNEHYVESSDTTVNWDSTYTVLENAPCPAVLTEQCFVTSPTDMDKFGDEDGCKLSARILYDAICAWYEETAAQ